MIWIRHSISLIRRKNSRHPDIPVLRTLSKMERMKNMWMRYTRYGVTSRYQMCLSQVLPIRHLRFPAHSKRVWSHQRIHSSVMVVSRLRTVIYSVIPMITVDMEWSTFPERWRNPATMLWCRLQQRKELHYLINIRCCLDLDSPRMSICRVNQAIPHSVGSYIMQIIWELYPLRYLRLDRV